MQEIDVNLSEEAQSRYLNYALSVVTSRALPDVRDGLKPVQRRLLYAMHENLKLGGNSRPRKSAAVVGEVLGKYHPHGDQAVYDTMVRLAQPFSLRYPLVNGEGNFGSLDGDGAAAMRYTESRLMPISEELFKDIKAGVVPKRPNYDATIDEPVVIPAAIPQLLINGAAGIAVGMATNIPSHNLREVVQALQLLIRKPQATTAEILNVLYGPDFPTGGEIITTKDDLRRIYDTGHGSIKVRGEWMQEPGRSGRYNVIITSLPPMVNKAQLIEKIANLVIERKVPQILDVRDESTADIRIVLEVKDLRSIPAAMAYVYKHSPLQISYAVNLTCLLPTQKDDETLEPQRTTLKSMMEHFLRFRFDIVSKRLQHEMAQLSARLHILEGFKQIFDQLEAVMAVIRSADSRQDAKVELQKLFELSEKQADAILDIRLYQLAKLEVSSIETEYEEKRARVTKITELLSEDAPRWGIISEELDAASKKYGDARRSPLRAPSSVDDEVGVNAEEYIEQEDAALIITKNGLVRRTRDVRERGKIRVKDGDEVMDVLVGNTRDKIGFFTSKGSLYVKGMHTFQPSSGYGEPVQTAFQFKDGENVIKVILISGDLKADPPQFLLTTKKGRGFRFRPELEETTKNGRRIARMDDDDEIAMVDVIKYGRLVCCTSKSGRVIAFPMADIAEVSGVGRGVILMRPVTSKDEIMYTMLPPGRGMIMHAVQGNTEKTVTKDVPIGKIPLGRRAGQGRAVWRMNGAWRINRIEPKHH